MMAMLRAKEAEDEKYLKAYNTSLGLSEESTLAISGASEKVQVSRMASVAGMDKMSKGLANGLKDESSKLMKEKSKAVEQVHTDCQIVSQAAERIKADAETFAVAGKDAWNSHYQRTESDLRTKSDDSSQHVKG